MDWFRFYHGVVSDPKIQILPQNLRWRWVECLCLASMNSDRGFLPCIEHVAFHMKVETQEAVEIVGDLVKAGLIDKTKGSNKLRMHKWETRQRASDDVTARTKKSKQRAKERKRNVPANVPGNELGTDESPAGARTRVCSALSSVSDSPDGGPGEDKKPDARSPEDQKQFDAALKLLGGCMATEPVSMELSRQADLPGVREIEGWRWLHAARKMTDGGQPLKYKYLLGTARSATVEEFEAYGKPSVNGKHESKPSAETNRPVKPSPEVLAKYQAEIDARPNKITRAEWEEQQRAKRGAV